MHVEEAEMGAWEGLPRAACRGVLDNDKRGGGEALRQQKRGARNWQNKRGVVRRRATIYVR